ncbi:MAG: hypothetical protein ACXVPQ_02350 [Bacteroidia bacterium]
MRFIAFVSVFLIAATTIAQVSKSRPPYVPKDFNYDKVIVYETDENSKLGAFYDDKFHPDALKAQKELTQGQTDSLHVLLHSFPACNAVLTKNWWYFYMTMIYYLNGKEVATYAFSRNCRVVYINFRRSGPENWGHSVFCFTEAQEKKLLRFYSGLAFAKK